MTPNTHLGIDARLCGRPTTLAEGRAAVRLETVPEMAADDRGLVHGGFVFGAADYAAMLCVNDPNVVLGAADTRFVAPVAVGEVVELEVVTGGEVEVVVDGTTAQALGVRVEMVRMTGMVMASVVTAVIVSFLGIIGFVGLVCPHIVRRVIGDDHRFLLPASVLTGACLLLAADITARLMLAPRILPVAILTAFLGAPTFLYLLITRRSG